MNITVRDGAVLFATHIITALGDHVDDPILDANNQVICYSNQEYLSMVSALERRGIKFKSEELSFPQEFKDKVNGLKYTSRSEAISHLQGEIDVPEQEVVAFLRKEKDLLESKLNAVISEKDDLKSRLDKIESDKSILQDRLGALEQDFALQKSLISKGGL